MAERNIVRYPSHAGSWYTSSGSQLSAQLDGWLATVSSPIACIGPRSAGENVTDLPVAGARLIIGPHAGYSYSGPAAAWAYKAWDVTKASSSGTGVTLRNGDKILTCTASKRIFLLGPSHHHYLTKAALTRCTHYGTPLGNLKIDREVTAELHKTGQFDWMSQSTDEDEHSLEMHLPYIYKILSRTFGEDATAHPPLVPIMVGNTSANTERMLGRILAPYIADPDNAFVISSDFAHWGLRFRYTYYQPHGSSSPVELTSSAKTPSSPPIHESIKTVDFACMGACESGSHEKWLDVLEATGNTVCGRHPIGVVMAGMAEVSQEGASTFRFVRYERSSEVRRVSDSSVSYASAFAVV